MAIRDDVETVIEEVRPFINMDGGDVELLDVNEETGVVTVQLYGACESCSMVNITLKAGIETRLKENVPGITEVISV